MFNIFTKNYSRRTVLWIDADTTPDIFWKRLCTSLNVVNATYANELLKAGFPYNDDDIRNITYILDMFPSKDSEYVVIIDNFDKIHTSILGRLFNANCIKNPLGISFVFIVKAEEAINNKSYHTKMK